MDEIDYEIIKILCKDARTPFKTIGRMLGIGTDTVFRRFKKLKQEGIVQGSTIILSSQACGFQGLCGIYIRLRSGASVSGVKSKLLKIRQVNSIVQIYGEYDFYVEMYFRDFQEILTLISSLRKIKEIVIVDPMIYTSRDWSLPFLFSFEREIPIWAFNVQNNTAHEPMQVQNKGKF